jgi:hypothetical protein
MMTMYLSHAFNIKNVVSKLCHSNVKIKNRPSSNERLKNNMHSEFLIQDILIFKSLI